MTHIWGSGEWGSGTWDSDTWGEDTWGDGSWVVDDNTAPSSLAVLIENWPLETVYPEDGEPIHNVLEAIGLYIEQTNGEIEELQEQRFLQTASDDALEKLAREVGVYRGRNELDRKLRFRTLIRKAGTQSDGTFDDVETILGIVFGDQASQISISKQTDSPELTFTLPQSLLDETPLTESELENALQEILPASTPITVVTGDILILGESEANGVGGKLV